MKRIPLNLVAVVAAAMVLSGCASSRKQAFDEPRAATVVEVVAPDSPYAKVNQGVSAGIFGVLGGLKRRQDEGGSLHPAAVAPAVGGLVDDARTAVSDSCARLIVVEFEDDRERAGIQARCDKPFSVGQKVTVARNTAAFDPRDVLQVTPR